MQFGQIFTNVIADAKLSLRCDYFIKLLVLQLLSAKWIVALDLSALLLVLVDLGQLEDLVAEFASYPEGMDDFLHDSTCTPDSNILMAAWAILVQLQPIFYTSFAEQLVAVIALLGFTADLETYLA